MADKVAPDWECIEADYRAGLKTLRQIADEHGLTHGAINKRAKRDGWSRDLSAKIAAKADALVSKAAVSKPVSAESKVTEREIVEANAEAVATAVLRERADVSRARRVVQRLWDLVDAELDHPAELAKLGEIMADANAGQDKLNDLYRAAIELPQHIKNAKLLGDALKVLIDLERKVLKLDDLPPDPVESAARGAAEGAARASVPGLADALEAFRAK